MCLSGRNIKGDQCGSLLCEPEKRKEMKQRIMKGNKNNAPLFQRFQFSNRFSRETQRGGRPSESYSISGCWAFTVSLYMMLCL